MTDYTVINGTEAVFAATGSVNVDALSYKDGVTMSAAEIATALVTAGVAVLKTAPSSELKRVIGIAAGKQSA